MKHSESVMAYRCKLTATFIKSTWYVCQESTVNELQFFYVLNHILTSRHSWNKRPEVFYGFVSHSTIAMVLT